MTTAHKVLTLEHLGRVLAGERARGKTVALANGLFDVLHVGHLRYLEAAAAEADLLVVAVNTDACARRLKGPRRPIVPDTERAELLAGFACVDFVVLFAEDSADGVLRALRPDVHCKGTDHTPDSVPEAATARELGVRVAIVGDAKRHATREMLERIARGAG